MKSKYVMVGFMLSTGMLLLVSCGQSDMAPTEKAEKGKIEQMTDKAANTAVNKIRTPLDKAKLTQQIGSDRLDAMDKALRENR